jgi:hypothetical protein
MGVAFPLLSGFGNILNGAIMSRTIETTSTPDLLIQAEPGTKGRREGDVCRKLAGKVAVITGASTGMCLATAKRFVQEGVDRVFITGRRKGALDGAVAEIGDKVTGIPGNVANLNDLDRLYESLKGYGRKLDVVFANAGIGQWASFGARARPIEVEVLYGAGALRLRIRDNGIGIGQKVLEQGARLGNWSLPGVGERAKLAGAKLNFWSEAGAGAEVQVTVTAAITYGKSSSSRIPLLPIFCGLKLADSNPRCR